MKKIIIIGAGPAGLTAGYELVKENEEYEVIILEADRQVGGISKTIEYNGYKMDLGGHRFFSKNEEIMNFWQNLMPIQGFASFDDEKLKREKILPLKGPNPNKENRVMLIRNRISRIYYLKKFFDYPISLKLKTITNLGIIKTLKIGFSYLDSKFKKNNEKSLEDFYIKRFGKELYTTFFEDYTEKVWGRHPSEISSDWGRQRVKGLSIIEIIKNFFIKNNKNKETSLIEQFLYPKYGPGQLWETLAMEFENKGGKIYKECFVDKINIENNEIQSVEYVQNNIRKKINADIFISSMPIKDLVKSINSDTIPQEIINISQNLPYRDFITVGLLLKKLNLNNTTKIKTLGNIIPDCWIYVQDSNVKLGRIQIFNNWSPYMLKNPEKEIWIGLEYFCNENDQYWNMSDKKFIEFAINELVSMNIINREDVLDAHIEKVKKAYPAYFDTYKDIDKVIKYLNTYENLFCIGRNGQHKYNNMDHSMLTAMEAVKNIKGNLKNKDNIWNVNSEQEYHETKRKIK